MKVKTVKFNAVNGDTNSKEACDLDILMNINHSKYFYFALTDSKYLV